MMKKSVNTEAMMKKAGILLMAAAAAGMAAGCSRSASSESEDGVRVVKVGTGNSMPPYCSLNDDGEVDGYDVAVLKELDSRLSQYEFDIQTMDFSTLIVSLDSNALDVVSHQLVPSTARKEKYLFPEQYYCLSPMCLAVRADSGINSLEDMAGKTIPQNPSSYEYAMLMAYNEQHPGQELNVQGVSDLTTADAFKQVANGQVDASLTYEATYENVQNELQLDNLTCTDVVMVEDTYIMFGADEQQLCDDVDAELKKMLEDGTLSRLAEEYLGEDIFTLYQDMITPVND